MYQYVIEVKSLPQSQHPLRYLETTCENLEEEMQRWGENKHVHEWEIVEAYPAVKQAVYSHATAIKYKYTRDNSHAKTQ